MLNEGSQPVSHHPDADRLVPVEIRSERGLRVVDMQAPQPVEADARIDIRERSIEHRGIGDVNARDIPVT